MVVVNNMSVEILKEKQHNIEKLIEELNLNKIPKLNVEIDKLYSKINEINKIISEIRNIPEEIELKRIEFAKELNNLKFKIEKMEKYYNSNISGYAVASIIIFSKLGFGLLMGYRNSIRSWLIALYTGWSYFSAKKEYEIFENIFLKILSNSEKKLQLGIVEINERIESIYNEIELLEKLYYEISSYAKNYNNFTYVQKLELMSSLNTMEATKKLITEPIKALIQNFDDDDYINYKGNDNDVKKKNLFVLLANMFKNIYLNEEERKIFVKCVKNNKDFFENENIRKEDMTLELLNDIFNALSKK